jgi:hypothetical protein
MLTIADFAADTPANTTPDIMAVELEDNPNYHVGWWDVAGWWGERQ